MHSTVPAPSPYRRRKKRLRYWLRRLIVLVIILLPLAAWYAWDITQELPLEAEGSAPRVATDQPVYVVILGVDERPNDVGRSDTLMLLRFDPGKQGADLINIPRDTRVTYASGKQSKINATYAIDGADFVTEVVSDLLSIPRPYYVKLNFQAFEEIVNQLGGVEIDVDQHYVYDDPFQHLHIDIPAGRQNMTGQTALHYVRLRYDGKTNSDLGRIGRQQQFIEALKQKASSPAYWSRIPKMMSTVRKHVKTNIPEADQLKLAQALYKARENLRMHTLPGTPDEQTSDWLLDQTKWRELTDAWTAE